MAMWLANHITSILGLASYHSYLSVHGIMELKDWLLKANQVLHNMQIDQNLTLLSDFDLVVNYIQHQGIFL